MLRRATALHAKVKIASSAMEPLHPFDPQTLGDG